MSGSVVPSSWQTVVSVVAGLASIFGVTVALIRPWIQEIRGRGRLHLQLVTATGDRTMMDTPTGQIPVFYYYIRVTNYRPVLPAKNTKVLVTGRSVPTENGRVREEPLVVPVPVTWNFPNEKPDAITISKTDVCAFGLQTAPDGITPVFYVSTYPKQTPRNFRTQLVPTEAVRLRFEAYADDCHSKPLVLEITNSGQFNAQGIKIKEVRSLE